MYNAEVKVLTSQFSFNLDKTQKIYITLVFENLMFSDQIIT